MGGTPKEREPSISVIVVSHDHERYIGQCLDAIAAQTYRDFELVVLDDSSSDASAERAETWLANSDLNATLIVNERNRGICATLNRALEHTTGDLISYVSADDYYEPGKLERERDLLSRSDPAVAFVYSDMRVVDADGQMLASTWYPRDRYPTGAPEGRVFDQVIAGNFISAPTVMMRRSAIESVGGYDESMVYEDFDLWLRITDRFEVRYLPEVLANFRVLPTSLSHSPERTIDVRESRVRALSKWFGTSAPIDDVIARRAWAIGRRTIVDDPRRARGMLRPVLEHQPTLSRRAVYGASYVPGFGQVIRASIALRDRLKP